MGKQKKKPWRWSPPKKGGGSISDQVPPGSVQEIEVGKLGEVPKASESSLPVPLKRRRITYKERRRLQKNAANSLLMAQVLKYYVRGMSKREVCRLLGIGGKLYDEIVGGETFLSSIGQIIQDSLAQSRSVLQAHSLAATHSIVNMATGAIPGNSTQLRAAQFVLQVSGIETGKTSQASGTVINLQINNDIGKLSLKQLEALAEQGQPTMIEGELVEAVEVKKEEVQLAKVPKKQR